MSSTASTVSVKPTVRDSGIELLRILAACGVVVLHYNGAAFPLVKDGSANSYILLLLEGLFVCAVNVFVLISGYFLSSTTKRKTVKAVELVVQVVVMALGLYLGTSLLSGSFTPGGALLSAVPNNYFVTLYITLYLISPYINLAINKLSDKALVVMTVMMLLLFSVWPTILDVIAETTGFVFGGLYTTNTGGSQFGYSVINFALMYLLGAVLRRKCIAFSKTVQLLGLVFCVAVLFLWQLYLPQIARSYCNIVVIATSIFCFLLFKEFTFKSKVINALSKAAFTCFLIHGAFLGLIGIERFVNANPLILVLHIAVSVLVIFLISFGVWKVYDLVTAPVFKALSLKLTRIDRIISPEEN